MPSPPENGLKNPLIKPENISWDGSLAAISKEDTGSLAQDAVLKYVDIRSLIKKPDRILNWTIITRVVILASLLVLLSVLQKYTEPICLDKGYPFTLTTSVIFFMIGFGIVLFFNLMRLVFHEKYKTNEEDEQNINLFSVVFEIILISERLLLSILWIVPLAWIGYFPVECNNSTGYWMVRLIFWTYLIWYPVIFLYYFCKSKDRNSATSSDSTSSKV